MSRESRSVSALAGRGLSPLLLVAIVLVAGGADAGISCEEETLVIGREPLGYRARGQVCGGEREGRWVFTFLDGKPLREGVYSAGRETGRWVEFHRKGGKFSEGEFANGRRVGVWTRWYQNGVKSQEGPFKGGLRDGRWRRWYEGGQLYEDRVYRLGSREEMQYRWERNGALVFVRECRADRCTVRCRGSGAKPCAFKVESPPAP